MEKREDSARKLESGGNVRDDQLAQLLWECIDRMNAGEELDHDRILRDHPDLGEELIEQLRVFHSCNSDTSPQDGDRTLQGPRGVGLWSEGTTDRQGGGRVGLSRA